MHVKLAKLLRNLLQRSGYFSTPSMPERDIATLLFQLRPQQTNHPLIRIGAGADGGYLIPDDLGGISYCFSPGVSTTAIFEEDLLHRGIKSFLADASIDAPPPSLREYTFIKKYLGSFDTDLYTTLDHWVTSSLPGDEGDLLLQMDIEGAEYPVLLQTPPETLRRFRIMAIEFHHIEQLINRAMFDVIRQTFEKLLRDFTIVHIHPNNAAGVNRIGHMHLPNLLEMTLLRHDRIAWRGPATAFPHPLDRKNLGTRPDVVLPGSWYR